MSQNTISFLAGDTLQDIFRFLPLEVNTQNRLVCKLWNQHSSAVIKQQLFDSKCANFLRLVNGKLEEYFPLFKDLWRNRDSLSIKKIAKGIKANVKKIKVFFCETNKIDAADRDIPSNLQNDLAGKVFATFLLNQQDEKYIEDDEDNGAESFFNVEGITYYPIELFQLRIKDQKIEGEIETGSHCFPISGKIFELTFCPVVNQDNVRKVATSKLLEISEGIGEFYFPRLEEKEEVNPLKRKNSDVE